MFTADRSGLREWMTNLPYTRTPGLRPFLLDVRARTKKGDRIVILSPYRQYQRGYVYVFSRATYLLAGRTTIPFIDEHDRAMPQNLASADYVAAYRSDVEISGYETVWSSPEGLLLRRVR